MKYRIFPAMAALLLTLALCPSAWAAEAEAPDGGETAVGQKASTQAERPALYPVEVLEYTAGDFDEPRISKTYELSPTDDPGLIPHRGF